jgi:hypothetical protein
MAKAHIYVWGPPIADHLQVMDFHDPSFGRYPFPKNPQSGFSISSTVLAGGAALLTDLIEQLASKDCAEVFGTSLAVPLADEGGSQRQRIVGSEQDHFHYNNLKDVPERWAVCHAYRSSGRDGHRNHVDGRFRYRQTGWSDFSSENWVPQPLKLKNSSSKDTGHQTLLVIDDRGRFFPGDLKQYFTPSDNDVASRADHIIVKAARPYPDPNQDQWTPLCTFLRNEPHLANKTTVVISLQGLRSLGLPIGMSISWEQLFEEVILALVNTQAGLFSEGDLVFSRVIVTLGLSGAVCVNRLPEKKATAELVFDPRCQESDYENRFQAVMDGYNTCVVAALATAWAESSVYERGKDSPVLVSEILDFAKATRIGIEMARLLHRNGYDPAIIADGKKQVLTFPYRKLEEQYYRYWQPVLRPAVGPLADSLLSTRPASLENAETRPFRDPRLAIFRIRKPERLDSLLKPGLSILQDAFWRQHLEDGDPAPTRGSAPSASVPESRLVALACSIAEKGPSEALRAIPVENVGRWYSADRTEIEGVRNVKNAIRDYLDNANEVRPLSIAVFGPPGAGKSFAVKEIAKDKAIQRHRLDILTFNLAQFKDPADLTKAFHQVRESTLRGKTPLVFWDEFDANTGGSQLFWLKYFLSPLQDGQFTDADGIHRIGRGVHVFAGSSRNTFEDFARLASSEEPGIKIKDFVSRMSAFLNVKGINPPKAEFSREEGDFMFVIRRAVLLHGLLRAHNAAGQGMMRVTVDRGILCALLLVPEYRHGARSMEAIVKTCLQPQKSRLQAGYIPAAAQLAMHVDADKFRKLASLRDERELIAHHDNQTADQWFAVLSKPSDHTFDFLDGVLGVKEADQADRDFEPIKTGPPGGVRYVLGYLTRDDFPGILHAVSRTLFAPASEGRGETRKGRGFNIVSVSVSSVPNCGGVYVICESILDAEKQFLNAKRCRSWLKWAASETLRAKYSERYNKTYLLKHKYAPRPPRFHVHVAIQEESIKYVYIEFLAPDQPGTIYSITNQLADNEWNIMEMSLKPAEPGLLEDVKGGVAYYYELAKCLSAPKVAHFCAWLSKIELKDEADAVLKQKAIDAVERTPRPAGLSVFVQVVPGRSLVWPYSATTQ